MNRIRLAAPADRLSVIRILEGALLELDVQTVAPAIAAGRVLVAGDPVVGALIAEPFPGGANLTGIAVRPHRRRSGMGTALIESATQRWGHLTAHFGPQARPFYAALDFTIHPVDDRLFGHRLAAD